ncbi:immunity 53 family protein [Paenibacillus contaminans]|uniref:Rhodanese-related sulfurtransferase n=1 Tax=Paenibacillus contaminans TaxID=450362 RepID=A0A329LU64_9BACL|nr:immunity 53 family protein [Paenibacillus contaminans]RAV10133.1 rhodanese-related sulfurtransferase [Paenibacillus contaminans]
MNLIKWLEDWYSSQCDGDWEHSHELKIGTIDNPGWYVFISLLDTDLKNKPFDPIILERNENDWFQCKLNNGSFEGVGGPSNLEEIITVFKNWVELG